MALGRVCMGVDSNAEVYSKYRDDLVRYATALVGPFDAEDVVSTVVLRTIRRRPLRDLEHPRAYLFKGVLNESRGLARGRRRAQLPESVVYDAPIELLDVLEAVWRLPIRQRAAIYLFYWEGFPIADIADAMGIGNGTVKRYLHLARKSLKGSLQ